MRRSKTDENIHQFLVSFEMFQSLPGNDTSKRVANKVDSLVTIERVEHMQSDLLSNGLTEFLNSVVNVIFDCFDQKAVTVRIVNIHEIPCFFKINTTALIPMNHNNEWLYFWWWSWCRNGRFKILDDEERMVDIMFLIDIHFGQNLASLCDKLCSFFLNLVMNNISIRQ